MKTRQETLHEVLGNKGVYGWLQRADYNDTPIPTVHEAMRIHADDTLRLYKDSIKENTLKSLEEFIKKIQKEANEGLEKLSKNVSKEDSEVNTMYLLSEYYYVEIARFAWAYRAKLIVSYELESLINQMKNE